MNAKTWAAASLAVLVLAAASAGLYWLGWQRGAMSAGAAGEGQAASGGRQVLYWHDPMVPGHKFDKPGKSPFMDMPLVPVYADAAAEEGQVSISPRVQQNLGVRTAPVTEGVLSVPVAAVGSIAYNENEAAAVQARSSGFLERLYVRSALERVRKGQVLAELYVPDWVAAQEEYLAVRRMGDSQRELRDAASQRMRLAGMTPGQIALVEASGKVQARMPVLAPIAGVVAELNVREGMSLAAGAALARINGLGTVWAEVELPERLAGNVRTGSAARIASPAHPGHVWEGKVSALLPAVDAATRTLKARVVLPNPDGALVPGMFVSATLSGPGGEAALLVPSEAVIRTGARTLVMVAQGGGQFSAVEVEAGAEANGLTQIRKGLAVGQQVVVSGQFLVDSEASLRGAARRLGEAAPPAAPEHHGDGIVEQLGKDEIVLSHRPVPTLDWGAMTMGFLPPAAGLPPGIKAGSQVAFSFRAREDGKYQITSIAVQERSK